MSKRGDRLTNKGKRGSRRAATERARADKPVKKRLSRNGKSKQAGEPPSRGRNRCRRARSAAHPRAWRLRRPAVDLWARDDLVLVIQGEDRLAG